MFTVSLKRPRVRLAAILVCLLLVLAAVFDIDLSGRYVEDYALDAPWGSGPGEFGAAVAADGSRYGPQAFGFKGDLLCVADTYNNRLLFFDAKGPAGTWEIPRGTLVDNLLVLSGDQVLVSDALGGRLLWIGPGGVTKEMVLYPKERLKGSFDFFVDAMALGPRGEVYVQDVLLEAGVVRRRLLEISGDEPLELSVSELLSDGRFSPASGGPFAGSLFDLAVGKDRLYFVSGRSGAFDWKIRVLDRGGDFIAESTLKSQTYVRSLQLAGVDRKGNLYIAENPGLPGGKISRLDRRGRYQTLFEVDLPGSQPFALAGADERGRLYLAYGDQDGFHLRRLRPRRSLSVRFLFAQ